MQRPLMVASATSLALASFATVAIIGSAGITTQQRATGYHVMGAGGFSCAEMTANLRADRASWADRYADYALGFVSGANFVSFKTHQPNATVGSTDVSPQELLASVERYCRQNPTKGLHVAIEAVYSELAAR
jgi:hypothetical protein